MRIVIQRVNQAKVVIDGEEAGAIGLGYVILLGVGMDDTKDDADWLIRKVIGLRVFADEAGKMNRSLNEVNGNLLVISQFTLHASYKKGNRPGFTQAAKPETAIPLYEYFLERMNAEVRGTVASGRFGADMKVHLVNDGPVTIMMDSKAPQ